MAYIRTVRDYRVRVCRKCGLRISGRGSENSFGNLYVRTTSNRRFNRYGSKEFTGRDFHPRARYLCADCYVDAKGDRILPMPKMLARPS